MKAIKWRENYVIKTIYNKDYEILKNKNVENKQEELNNENVLDSRKKKKKLTKMKKVILIEKGKLEIPKEEGEEEEEEKDEKKEETEEEKQLTIELSKFVNRQESIYQTKNQKSYVNQLLSPELDCVVVELFQKLTKFQTKLKQTQPLKYKSKKRYVVGLREVERAIKSNRLRAIFISPNIDKIISPGGLDETIIEILNYAYENRVGVVFCLNTRKMGKSIGKNIKISIIV
jgi:selenocysteine insertion sequence-binding protein 2